MPLAIIKVNKKYRFDTMLTFCCWPFLISWKSVVVEYCENVKCEFEIVFCFSPKLLGKMSEQAIMIELEASAEILLVGIKINVQL